MRIVPDTKYPDQCEIWDLGDGGSPIRMPKGFDWSAVVEGLTKKNREDEQVHQDRLRRFRRMILAGHDIRVAEDAVGLRHHPDVKSIVAELGKSRPRKSRLVEES